MGVDWVRQSCRSSSCPKLVTQYHIETQLLGGGLVRELLVLWRDLRTNPQVVSWYKRRRLCLDSRDLLPSRETVPFEVNGRTEDSVWCHVVQRHKMSCLWCGLCCVYVPSLSCGLGMRLSLAGAHKSARDTGLALTLLVALLVLAGEVWIVVLVVRSHLLFSYWKLESCGSRSQA